MALVDIPAGTEWYSKAVVDSKIANIVTTSTTVNNIQSRPLALNRLFAGLAARNQTPANIVFTGSSTTAGTAASDAAHRYVSLLVSYMQAEFPSSQGIEAATVYDANAAWPAPSTLAGVHGYGAGEGGTTSANYLTDAEITTIMAMNPSAVFHMIGANDYGNNVDPATYKANVLGRVNKVKSLATRPTVQVLINTYARYDTTATTTATFPWTQYGAQLKAIADGDTDNVIYLDMNPVYVALGIPSTDPFGLMSSDKIHQNDAGHAFMADLLAYMLGLTRTFPQTATNTTATQTLNIQRFTSDAFSAADGEIAGTNSDGLLGGVPRAWIGSSATTGFNRSTQRVVTANDTSLQGISFALPSNVDMQVSFDLIAGNTSGGATVSLYSATSTPSGTPDRLGLVFNTGGATMNLSQRISGTSTNLAAGMNISEWVGHRLTLRFYQGSLSVYKDGVFAQSAIPPTTPVRGGYMMLSRNGTGLTIDGLTLDVITPV